MEKKINISIVIMSILQGICYFIPFCISQDLWLYEKSLVYHGRAKLENSLGINIFQIDVPFAKVLAVLLFCVTLLTAIVYFLKVMEYQTILWKKEWIVSIVNTAMMVVFLLYTCGAATVEQISWKLTYSIDWMFYIIIALNVISLILALLVRYGKLGAEGAKPFRKNADGEKQLAASLDSLIAYKKLLDEGVLTEEEFKRKKEQILKLESRD